MDISLTQAQFLSLGLTTFLYGASLRKSLCLAFARANCTRTGVFFMLFLTTTAVMSSSVSEDIRRQRNKILPVSTLMLMVATLVRTLPFHG